MVKKEIAAKKNVIELDEDLHWYKDAIIYELHIKAFFDSNADGIGDFQGLLTKLDYLENLGVTAIWLLPFYPSPLRDDGYDIADYYSINPTYGNIASFKRFLKEAHKRNLKVITELVINHTSDQHPWFQRARRAKPGSAYRDYYVWSDDPEKYKDARIIFNDFEQSNWTWDDVAGQYYWHRFYSHQPDLNFDNPRVQKEIFRILDYWFDMGVDGFRLDAIPYLFQRENTNCENLPETHVFLKKLRKHVDSKYKGKLLLAEANMWPEDSAAYFGDGDECHMNYHFPIMPRMFMALKMEDRYPLTDIFDQTPDIPETCQWAMFLRNHDELTLEMVTDEERDYMYKVYTKDPKAKINMGIRHRLAPLLDNNRRKIELMNYLLFSLSGTPVLYYGDEIGMGDNYYLGDRDGVRTPMQWSADRNAGFSEANPQKLYLPVILDPEYHYDAVNVETQLNNPSSLIWWMKRVIGMRKQFKAFSRGNIKFLSPSNSKVLAFLRIYKDETILVIANLSRYSQAIELDLQDYKEAIPIEVFSNNKFPAIKEASYLITLGPHGYYWFLLEQQVASLAETDDTSKSKMSVTKYEDLFKPANLKNLTNKLIKNYIRTCRWFGGKARTIREVNIAEAIHFSFHQERFSWLIIEVIYIEGLPELYQLPVSFASKESESVLREESLSSIIALVTIGDTKGVLYDAVHSRLFREALFENLVKKRQIKEKAGDLVFFVNKDFENSRKKDQDKEFHARILSAEQSNTSIIYNRKYFFKLYRKLDRVVNPDVEILRFLTEKTSFGNVPRFMGSIEHHKAKLSPIVMGMMQELVENQGDAWDYTNDELNRYFERVLASPDFKTVPPLKGSIMLPDCFEKIDEEIEELIGVPVFERISLLAKRTAEMHIALASRKNDPDFTPEAFSLHYQRSLFSSLQSLTRTSYQSLEKNINKIPESMKAEAGEILGMKTEILNRMKKIYSRKFNSLKIRNHGDYHLGQVLFTGKDFYIIDFEGEPARSFSERRLKRSPLRDVAGMLRSFHYATYSALFKHTAIRQEDVEILEKWAELWYHYISGIFIKNYLQVVEKTKLIPDNQEDLETMLNTYILEKAVYELNYELNNRPDWVIIPVKGIKSIMQQQ
ncbi:MAG: maltose alpha-D-glucosyltransferase [Bacteroidales bacterium]